MPYAFKHGDRPLEGITVQRAVGRGGFGEVYYALADSGKQVALKYLRENPEIELRGIAHVMNLKSPHLITIYDVKRNATNEPFVIMEYVSGPSLRELLLAEPGGFSVQKAAYLLNGIAAGLTELHERGIVHRDLKPANIFYDDGYVKIGDYGLSKHMSVSHHSGQTVSIGTVYYMAPEIGSGSYTKLVDVYALGVILYEMLTGRLPFTGASLAEVVVRQLHDQPDTSTLPPGFAPVVARALAKNPAERYPSVTELAAAVSKVADQDGRLSAFDPLTLSQSPRQTAPEPPVGIPAAPPRVAVAPVLDARLPAGSSPRRESRDMPPPYYWPSPAGDCRPPDESSFAVWMYALIAAQGLFVLVELSFGDIRRGHAEGLLAHLAVLIPALIIGSVLVYRWFAALPDGWRRTTPVKAVGFSFIPIFNWYWAFVITHGLAVDVNHYLGKHGVARQHVSAGLALAYSIVLVVRSAAALFGWPTPALTVACAALGIPFVVLATRACRAAVRTRLGLTVT